ncbi:TPA: DUF721 domain-containing protein [Vibrio vulnificus]|uniref:DUF721 domain-containing protein n=1 Tax=Vibrio sp. 05-20-BW147 TaxID=2575834 RepID=UPI001594742A|nr:DciA family protein [Vibrio sp. 05-20-BW147]NVC63465.1 DUF721 domain-containing protein [Vibrio sp. 05-20-BW147]HAS6348216.1 DUF721 domain-containing protein [Vibrio vulnificus]
MRDHRPTSTQELIDNSSLQKIQHHASEILALNKMLAELLPKGTAQHCRAANLRQGCLILDVASAAIKMKIDYERLTILNALRAKGFAKLMGIEVRINPGLYRDKDPKDHKKRPPISENAAKALTMIADIAPPKVKARLERIAAMAEKKKP